MESEAAACSGRRIGSGGSWRTGSDARGDIRAASTSVSGAAITAAGPQSLSEDALGHCRERNPARAVQPAGRCRSLGVSRSSSHDADSDRLLGDDQYDVDSVCLLQLSPNEVSQQRLQQLVGDRLKHPQSRYKGMIKPPEGGRRCWTIQYADASKFHLDVLPAIPGRLRLAAGAWRAGGVGGKRHLSD